ncbi:hypothetical protein Pcac1_g22572 [Phytophthora cactorum]|nr:hypothetical protein Pcac1_g22572 [Phytophthora cactorum]
MKRQGMFVQDMSFDAAFFSQRDQGVAAHARISRS